MAESAALQQSIGVTFKNETILLQALQHTSYCHENPECAAESNERLEFLGDAVLGLVMAEKLYQDYPAMAEGEMTKMRSALVCQDTLAQVARDMNLGDYLFLGKGEEAGGGRNKPANLARALEALIGAVFLDRGIVAVREFILRWFRTELKEVTARGTEVNYKSELQELVQSRQQSPPTYRIAEVVGPDHDRIFTVEVLLDKMVVGRGSGKSKRS